MAIFPIIYHHGTLQQTPYIEQLTQAADPTIRTEVEAGYVASRAKFTRVRRKWSLKFSMVSADNKNTIEDFVAARGVGGEYFTWVEPVDGGSVTVRFADIPEYVPVDGTANERWDIGMILEEV